MMSVPSDSFPADVPHARLSGEILTSEEVAERLKVKAVTVRRWASIGKIPAGRCPDGDWRFIWPSVFAAIFPTEQRTDEPVPLPEVIGQQD